MSHQGGAAGGAQRLEDEFYDIMKRFSNKQWKQFARSARGLQLTESEIDDIKTDHRDDAKEQKYQMLLLWQSLNGQRATSGLLKSIVDQYLSPHGQAASQSNGSNPTMEQLEHTSNDFGSASARAGDVNQRSSLMKASGDEVSERTDQLNEASSRLEKSHGNGQRVELCYPEAPNVSSDIAPKKAFGIEKTPERQHKRSESGNASINSAISEPYGSSDSVSKKKGQSGLLNTLKKIIPSKKKADKTKAFSTEDGARRDMCDTVLYDKVKPSTKEDIKRILKIDDRYETEKHRGCALILNNSFLAIKRLRRHGAERDVANMEELWSQMGCDIYGEVAQQEKTADEMKQLLEDMRNLQRKYSYIVVVIMTHGTLVGGNIVFQGVDEKYIYVNEIDTIFNNQNAPRLRNIPKFFIFQFCCGNQLDRGVTADCKKLEAEIEQLSADRVHTDGDRDKMPTNSDMLFAYATHVNHYALRSPSNGSWFITAITNVFMHLASCEDVQRMLNRVRENMKGKFGWYEDVVDGKTVSCEVYAMGWSRSSFTKQLFLLPGHKRS